MTNPFSGTKSPSAYETSQFISTEVTKFFENVYSKNTIKFQNNFLKNITETEKQTLNSMVSSGHSIDEAKILFFENKYKSTLDKLVNKMASCKSHKIEKLRSLSALSHNTIMSELSN